MTKLKKYNPKEACPKCGGKDINDLWLAKYLGYKRENDSTPTEAHIGRHCRRCKYTWYVRPLDKD